MKGENQIYRLRVEVLHRVEIFRNNELSGARDFHPRALPEPDMNLSTHPAPIVQPELEGVSNEQKAPADGERHAAANAVPFGYAPSVACISGKPT